MCAVLSGGQSPLSSKSLPDSCYSETLHRVQFSTVILCYASGDVIYLWHFMIGCVKFKCIRFCWLQASARPMDIFL